MLKYRATFNVEITFLQLIQNLPTQPFKGFLPNIHISKYFYIEQNQLLNWHYFSCSEDESDSNLISLASNYLCVDKKQRML